MFEKLLKYFGVPTNLVETAEVSKLVNSMSFEDAQKEAGKLLSCSDLWDVTLRGASSETPIHEFGPLNRDFFSKYEEVHAKFMSLQIGYVGHPSWLPETIDSNLRVIGHTVEQEYLFCQVHSDAVFEFALDDDDEPMGDKLNSICHAIIFYHKAYGAK